MCDTEPSIVLRMARSRQWLQAILDYTCEEGDIEHINCPHLPSHYKRVANQRPKEMVYVVPYIGMW